MQETILKLVQTVNSYLADYILIILLVGTGLFFTFKTRFVQVRCFGEGMKRTFGDLSLKGEKHGKTGSDEPVFFVIIPAELLHFLST